MGYVWREFGQLQEVVMTVSHIVVRNVHGEQRQMSRRKYKHSADEVYKKSLKLIGEYVTVRTSQNTNNWNSDVWFSDIQ